MNPPKPRVLLLDHFDSFTYNLMQYLSELEAKVFVLKTNTTMDDLKKINPTHLVLSPGPGHPKNVPLFQEALNFWGNKIPILGVCLGHQAIALFAGAKIERNFQILHGKTSNIFHSNHPLFAGLPNPFLAGRYHSLIVSKNDCLHHNLEIIAWTDENEVMGVAPFNQKNILGIQFHPESILTQNGITIFQNFLAL